MNISTAIRGIAFQLNDMVSRTHDVEYLHRLERTQWLPLTELRDLQQKKLRALITHAYKNVPYYHKVFREVGMKPDDIKSVNDLLKLPLLTKEIIKKSVPSDIIAKSYDKLKLIKSFTSGTTGDPLIFYRDKEAWSWARAAEFRGWGWGGYKLGDKHIRLWRSPTTIREYSKINYKLKNIFRGIILLHSLDINEEILRAHVDKLRNLNPKIILTYPSAAYELAEFMRREGIDYISPQSILAGCEKLYDFQRKTIESQFGCEVFKWYGSSEIRGIAFECEARRLHITMENIIVEIVKDGERVAPGELGEIVVTDLNNYAMPFIRYKIGDIGMLSDETCGCGRELPLIKSVEGRIRDFIVTPQNKMLSPSFFIDLFNDFKFIKQFQVVQKTKEDIVVKIVSEQKPEEDEINRFLNLIQENTDDMNIAVDFVDSIPPNKSSGKLELVIRIRR